jgi:hypothetical protein
VSRHGAQPEQYGRRRAEPARPRWGRIAILGASLLTTGIAMLGGVGVLPSAADQTARAATVADDTGPAPRTAAGPDVPTVTVAPSAGRQGNGRTDQRAQRAADLKPRHQPTGGELDVALPGDSGDGRRVVFSESRQRVWLVDDAGAVERTYLVSGSVEDNLDPGTYSVYSRSEDAIGIDGSSMRLFVRFTRGPSGAAIGFHDIPTDPENDDRPVQRLSELGTPQSHGCVRQKHADARAMWAFADDGTTVVVTP